MLYEIRSKLVGVSFVNDDGSNRQELIKNLKLSDVLTIEHEPTNPYDSNSHIIKNPAGQIIGHLKRELAKDIIDRKAKGHVLKGIKSFQPTGDISKKQSLGVNIVLELDNDYVAI
jgi:hypothetical protein